MKTIKFLSVLFISSMLFTACSDDKPEEVNEEEVITKVTLTFTNTADATDKVVLVNNAPEGQDGPSTNETPVGNFTAGATYSLSLEILNGDEDVLTEDIIPEADEHFFKYSVSGLDLNMARDNDDTIGAGNSKLGIKTTWTPNAATSGSIQIILVHQPTTTDASNGWGDSTGGSEDINITFTGVSIQ